MRTGVRWLKQRRIHLNQESTARLPREPEDRKEINTTEKLIAWISRVGGNMLIERP